MAAFPLTVLSAELNTQVITPQSPNFSTQNSQSRTGIKFINYFSKFNIFSFTFIIKPKIQEERSQIRLRNTQNGKTFCQILPVVSEFLASNMLNNISHTVKKSVTDANVKVETFPNSTLSFFLSMTYCFHLEI